MAGLKGSGRALEKTIRCYGEDASRLCDVVRQVRVRTRALLRARGAARRHGGWPGGGIEQTLLLAAVLMSRGEHALALGTRPPRHTALKCAYARLSARASATQPMCVTASPLPRHPLQCPPSSSSSSPADNYWREHTQAAPGLGASALQQSHRWRTLRLITCPRSSACAHPLPTRALWRACDSPFPSHTAQMIVFEDVGGLQRCLEAIGAEEGGGGVVAVVVRVKNRYDSKYDALECAGYR